MIGGTHKLYGKRLGRFKRSSLDGDTTSILQLSGQPGRVINLWQTIFSFVLVVKKIVRNFNEKPRLTVVKFLCYT